MTVPFIGQRGDELMLMPGCHKTHSLGAFAMALSGEAFPFGASTIGIVFRIIDSRLVEIHSLMGFVLR
jgi:hypothetical protein